MFTDKDLGNIKRRTSNNYHSENRLFIAQKLGATSQAKIIKDTVKERDKIGYLDSNTFNKQQKAWEEVENIGIKKLGSAWSKIKSRL